MFKKKVKICVLNKFCTPVQKGNWIDLKSAITITMKGNAQFEYIPLGIKTLLPKWYKAEAKPRSSTYKNYGVIMTNSLGEIEHDYGGEWVFPVLSFKEKTIKQGDAICQFQVKLREDAPWYMKIMDLFTKIKLVYVKESEITGKRRGLGSTGK